MKKHPVFWKPCGPGNFNVAYVVILSHSE